MLQGNVYHQGRTGRCSAWGHWRSAPACGPAVYDGGMSIGTAYGYIRPSTYPQVLTSQAQKEEIDQAYQDRCPGVPWGGFFKDPQISVHLRLAKRKAGRQLLLRLKPGDHLFVTGMDRIFWSLSETRAYLKDWFDRGVKVHLLDFAFDTSKPEVSRSMLKTLADCIKFKRDLARETAAMNRIAQSN